VTEVAARILAQGDEYKGKVRQTSETEGARGGGGGDVLR